MENESDDDQLEAVLATEPEVLVLEDTLPGWKAEALVYPNFEVDVENLHANEGAGVVVETTQKVSPEDDNETGSHHGEVQLQKCEMEFEEEYPATRRNLGKVPTEVYERKKIVWKDRWRENARKRRINACKRNADFVSWEARFTRSVKSGKIESTTQPPLPFDLIKREREKRRKEQAVENLNREERDPPAFARKEAPDREDKVGIKGTKRLVHSKILEVERCSSDRGTQTAPALYRLSKTEKWPSRARRDATNSLKRLIDNQEQLSMTETGTEKDLFQFLSVPGFNGNPALEKKVKLECTFPEEGSKEAWELKICDSRRKLNGSFGAIHRILHHRWTAAKIRIHELKIELEEVIEEIEIQVQKKSEKYSERNVKTRHAQGVRQPSFIGGIAAEKSWNRRAWISERERKRKGWDHISSAFITGVDRANTKWEGDDFKINMLQDLKNKLLLAITFQSLSTNSVLNVCRRKLCLERSDLLDRSIVLKAFAGLSLFYNDRHWLRSRCQERLCLRQQTLLRESFMLWVVEARSSLLEKGKLLVAEYHRHRRLKWKAFVAWKSSLLVVERYRALSRIVASNWFRKVTLYRALIGWRQQTVRNKIIRLRLVLLCKGEIKKYNGGFPSANKLCTLAIPFQLSIENIHVTMALKKAMIRKELDQARNQTLREATISAVSLSCYSVQYQDSGERELENSRSTVLVDLNKVQLKRIRQKKIYESYTRVARIGAARIVALSSGPEAVSRYSRRKYEQEISLAVVKKLLPLGVGRLVAFPLRTHIRALEAFLNGESLSYPLRLFPAEIDGDSSSVRESIEKGFTEMDTTLGEYSKLFRRFVGTDWFRHWRCALSRGVFERKLRSRYFLQWKLNAGASKKLHTAIEKYHMQLKYKVFNVLRKYLFFVEARNDWCETRFRTLSLRRYFSMWQDYRIFWKWKSLNGPFSVWTRWKKWAKIRRLFRQRVLRLGTLQIMRRCLRQWLVVHSRRRLLTKVLGDREARWESRLRNSDCDVYTLQFRLMKKVFHVWIDEVASIRRNRIIEEQKEAAIFLNNLNVRKRHFLAWKEQWVKSVGLSEGFRYGWPVWGPSNQQCNESSHDGISFLEAIGNRQIAFERSALWGMRRSNKRASPL